jgi:hypothetical protein
LGAICYLATVVPAISGDRLEGNATYDSDILGSPRVRAADAFAIRESADATANPAELDIHGLVVHAVGEVANPDETLLALSTTLNFDLDATHLRLQALIPVVGVGDQLDECVVDIPDRLLRVLVPVSGVAEVKLADLLASHGGPPLGGDARAHDGFTTHEKLQDVGLARQLRLVTQPLDTLIADAPGSVRSTTEEVSKITQCGGESLRIRLKR